MAYYTIEHEIADDLNIENLIKNYPSLKAKKFKFKN